MGIQQIPLGSSGLAVSDLVTVTNWTLLGENRTTTATNGLSVSSIPSTYRNLKIYIHNLRPSTDNTVSYFRFNSDSTSNVYSALQYGFRDNSATVDIVSGSDNAFLNFTQSNSYSLTGEFTVFNYADTTQEEKMIEGTYYARNNTAQFFRTYRGMWRPTSAAAITSVNITNDGPNIAFVNHQSSGLFVFGGK